MIRVCEKQRQRRFPEQVARDPERFRLSDEPARISQRWGHVHCVGPIERGTVDAWD